MNWFEGWYFRQQGSRAHLSLMPGRTGKLAFLQILTPEQCLFLPYPASAFQKEDVLRIGESTFSRAGISLNIHRRGLDLTGQLLFREPVLAGHGLPLSGRFPTGCRREAASLAHGLYGTVTWNGAELDFHGGTGYAEYAAGRSFPESFFWLQCGDLLPGCSLLVSITRFSLLGHSWTDARCFLRLSGREYHFLTRSGARLEALSKKRLELSQGELRLKIHISHSGGQTILLPEQGQLRRRVQAAPCCTVQVRLTRQDRVLLDAASSHAGFALSGDPGAG